ncbi:MAG: FAD-binding oxidoreductase, partial [Propionibacteriaceae bacterium]
MSTLDTLLEACRREGVRERIATSTLDRALYTSDASLYRVEPLAIARPQSVAEVQRIVAAAGAARTPITARGAGTSCCGNAVGPGLIVDLRSLNRILSIDPGSRTAVVEPGVVLADLNRAAA